MAIAPRCALGGNGVSATTTVTPALTGWTNLGGPAGTAPASGDIVLFCIIRNATAWTLSQTSGTGTWTIQDSGTTVSASPASEVAIAWRIFDGTETAPTFTQTGGSGRFAWAMIAVTPDAGSTISIDVWATLKLDATAGTSHTANSAAASGTDCSLILAGLLASANGTTAITPTPPTGWTTGENSSNPGGSTTKSVNATILYKESVTGTVAPGAETTNVSTAAGLYHVLLQEGGASVPIPLPSNVRCVAVNRAAYY